MLVDRDKLNISLLFASTFLVLMDRPLMYTLESILGLAFSSNRLLLILVVPLIFFHAKKIRLSNIEVTVFFVTLLSFVVGVIFLDEFDGSEIISIIGVIFPFFLGVILSRYFHEKIFKTFLLYVAVFPALVGLLAVTNIFPSIFKIVNQLHMVDGELVNRPEVFTDQNFHIMYVFWLIPLVNFIKGKVSYFIWFSLVATNLFVLAAIQTRSGLIYFLFCSVFFMYIYQTIKWKHWFFLMAFLIFFSLFFVDYLIAYISETTIYARFSQNTETGSHRIESFTFWIYRLFDFEYWVPFGNSEFDQIYGGNIPHSNITAFYLNGGIMALVGYFYLILIPLVKLWGRKLKGLLDAEQKFVLVCCFTMLLVQTSLNLPYNEQVWFWAGLCLGVVNATSKKVINVLMSKKNKVNYVN